MSISFNTIPNQLKVPLFYAEIDHSQAGYATQNYRALLIGQKLPNTPGETNTPTLLTRLDEAKVHYGSGSMLARMYEAYRANDAINEVWCIALEEKESANMQAASGKIDIAGIATENGTLFLYIAGQCLQVGIARLEKADAICKKIADAINATDSLPVIATYAGTIVSLTSKWKGDSSNDITLLLNYRGLTQGEKLPAGIKITCQKMTGGAGYPDLSPTIAKLGDEEYDFIILPYANAATLDAIGLEMNDSGGRWSYARQIYGHVYTAKRGYLRELQALGRSRNDPHITIAGFEFGVPTPCWEYAAQYGGRNAQFISLDPARPTQTGELIGALPAPAGERFLMSERQMLLSNGIATSFTATGAICIERAITTYQRNKWNQPDPSYLDSETLHTSAYVLRFLRKRITSKYGRHKLANDGTRFGAGQAIVTPQVIRGELIAAYRELEDQGIVENAALFAKYLIVERPANDPNRLNILLPPDYVNQLRIFAVLNQFRLQYNAAA